MKRRHVLQTIGGTIAGTSVLGTGIVSAQTTALDIYVHFSQAAIDYVENKGDKDLSEWYFDANRYTELPFDKANISMEDGGVGYGEFGVDVPSDKTSDADKLLEWWDDYLNSSDYEASHSNLLIMSRSETTDLKETGYSGFCPKGQGLANAAWIAAAEAVDDAPRTLPEFSDEWWAFAVQGMPHEVGHNVGLCHKHGSRKIDDGGLFSEGETYVTTMFGEDQPNDTCPDNHCDDVILNKEIDKRQFRFSECVENLSDSDFCTDVDSDTGLE